MSRSDPLPRDARDRWRWLRSPGDGTSPRTDRRESPALEDWDADEADDDDLAGRDEDDPD
jgi:hypothetical protein